jgi:prolyl-tRNA synthetase
MKQVKQDMEMTESVMHKLFAIPFLFFKRPQHDKFKGAVETFAADSLMPDGKVIQLPSTHFLGQNFSKAFDIKFIDKDEKEKYVWQTCYGPAFWRILAAVIAIHGDDKGLVLPPRIAPIQAVIVPIFGKDDRKVMKKAGNVEKLLKENGFEVRVDDRKEYTPGWKYNYWELKGVPVRIEIGPIDVKRKQVIAVRRDSGKKVPVKDKLLVKILRKMLEDIQNGLMRKADKFFKDNLFEAKDFETLKKVLKRGGIVRTNWCGRKECADYIKTETDGGSIRGTLFDKKEKVFGKCVWCKKEAREVVYIAKSY